MAARFPFYSQAKCTTPTGYCQVCIPNFFRRRKKSGKSSFSQIERPKDMSKIRSLLSSLTDEQIDQALKMFKGDNGQ
jgi:hypothetical protein